MVNEDAVVKSPSVRIGRQDYQCTIPTNPVCHCHRGVRPPVFWPVSSVIGGVRRQPGSVIGKVWFSGTVNAMRQGVVPIRAAARRHLSPSSGLPPLSPVLIFLIFFVIDQPPAGLVGMVQYCSARVQQVRRLGETRRKVKKNKKGKKFQVPVANSQTEY